MPMEVFSYPSLLGVTSARRNCLDGPICGHPQLGGISISAHQSWTLLVGEPRPDIGKVSYTGETGDRVAPLFHLPTPEDLDLGGLPFPVFSLPDKWCANISLSPHAPA
jgi:hypothetical protein